MNICAWQFFECAAWSEGVNGDVIAARDNGELLGTAAAVVGEDFGGGGRVVSKEGLGMVCGGRGASSPLVYRWD